MNKFEKLEREGIFENGVTVKELIAFLNDYAEIYGDNPVTITIEGDRDTRTEFVPYGNALLIDVLERDEDEV